MIQLSIKGIDPNLITNASLDQATPIFFIRELNELRKLIPASDFKFLKAINFQGFYGERIILSEPDGKIGKVIIGCKENEKIKPVFCIGSQISNLPDGTYSLKHLPDYMDIRELYLGFYFSFYSYKLHKSSGKKTGKLSKPRICESPLTDHSKFVYFAESEFIARDLINSPANYLGPLELEEYASNFADFHQMSFSTIRGADLIGENLPLIHDVGRASEQEPRLIEMEWGKEKGAFGVTLVGKGVCFDSGGLNLKSPAGMRNMKKDMAGAAVVLALAHYLISSGLDLHLRILIPCVENSVASNAFRQGDVLKSRSGKSVEVQNTDAEGRLILADALTLASEESPDLLISFASLTGSARVAMGPDLTPFFSTDDYVANLVQSSGKELLDPVWQLPFYEGYQEYLGSEIADLNNAPSGGMAGSITAALFLKQFTNDHKKFLHFDIFGWNQKSRPGKSYGGLLQGARALAGGIEKILKSHAQS